MSSAEESKRLARSQFANAAELYVAAPILAEGSELGRLVELAGLRGDELVLDVATGGGHTALAFAPRVAAVVACDLTPRMLAAARRHARSRGVANVTFGIADAESLPFAGAAFDAVTCRLAPHHFPSPASFLAEARRVLRPGGRLLLFDNMVPDDDELDRFMNRFERWRDPSHVRAHRLPEWRAMMATAGLTVTAADPLSRKLYPFADWTARMSMPADEKRALERWLGSASPRCAEYFAIRSAGGCVESLEATFGTVCARRP